MLAEPLWHVRNGGRVAPLPDTAAACASDCGAGFDPFAWLVRLFDGGDPGSSAGAGGDGTGDRGDALAAGAGPASETPSGSGAAARETEAPETPTSGIEEPATAALPAPGSGPGQAPGPAQVDPVAGDLRTGEIVARIWIAPFVDANGVYREASHVRVVLEPAGWRLP